MALQKYLTQLNTKNYTATTLNTLHIMKTESKHHLLLIKRALSTDLIKLKLKRKSEPLSELVNINIDIEQTNVLIEAITNELKTKHNYE